MTECTFTHHVDGTVTVDGFPGEIEVARELLETPPYSEMFRRNGDRIHINVANGSATYLLVDEEQSFTRNVVRGVRLYSRLDA